jgi:hypothetical protein
LYASGLTEGFYNYLYSFLFGLIPLFGGAAAMYRSGLWGRFKSSVGKAVFFIGLGIFLWGCGETIWSYYNFFLGIPAPYPSLADFGFAPSIFFYGIGAVYLSTASGAKFGLRSSRAKIFVAVALIILFILSHYLLVTVARGGVLIPEGDAGLKALLDLLYPFGDFVALTLAVITSGLSLKYLGGKHIIDIVAVWLGLAAMFVGDTIFSYTTTIGTYYNGNFGDLVLMLGTSSLTFGVLGFYNLKSGEK